MDPYQPSYLESFQQPGELRHSGFGIASFVLACLSLLGMFGVFFVAGYLGATQPELVSKENSVTVMLGLTIMALGALLLLAAVLGLVGLFQSNRKKVFAVLGFGLSALVLIGSGALIGWGIWLNEHS